MSREESPVGLRALRVLPRLRHDPGGAITERPAMSGSFCISAATIAGSVQLVATDRACARGFSIEGAVLYAADPPGGMLRYFHPAPTMAWAR